jgi:pyruvate dehydrogenase complex dehydrogenase (E1) component
VSRFGQSGDLQRLYEHHGIDPETIIGAALDVMGYGGTSAGKASNGLPAHS